MTSSLYCCCN